MCGPHRRFAPLLSRTLCLIPQAVSTVATGYATSSTNASSCSVSIPQVVSAVATGLLEAASYTEFIEFQYRKQ